jgi:hypothetical protein
MSDVEIIREPKKVAPSAPVAPKTWRIILEDNDDIPPTGQFFGINGKGFILKSGVEAEVPESIIGILNDAIQSAPVRDPDNNNKIIGYKDRLRFPYRVVRQPK